ncbi:MAG: PadR family transcriptional regulator [Kordiimonadaceae bacterium]|nr:PadR family transcriptional regulator [Kordiimonadaceae bacterium]MBO6567528.1 PadR family transcriptional regulator [Kordiimonadaceae bacterium]MBO6963258.1 PadR family transcriptional regulator [Kordiimonadaceae bacterium]
MALKYAILVALSGGPKSGYDVAKQFDQDMGFFWRAQHSQIYRELGKLKKNGLVDAEEVQQSGKPNRVVFTINEKGRESLYKWSREPSRSAKFKDTFLVQLYALDSIDMDAFRQNLQRRLELCQDLLLEYETKHRALEHSDTLADQGKQLALDAGIRWSREWIDWCTVALQKLAPQAAADLTNIVPMKNVGKTSDK